MTGIPALTEKQLEPLARAICALEDAAGELERERIRPAYAAEWDHQNDPPSYEQLSAARCALANEVGNLIRRVASAALAQHASRFLAETENEVVAP